MTEKDQELAVDERGPRKRGKGTPSQLLDLFFHVAEALGYGSDREAADLAGVTVENVANWRSGSVREVKPQKLKAIKDRIGARIDALKRIAGQGGLGAGVTALEIEEGSGPSDLLKQFRERVAYDYLGHRFLYYEPMGALAWQSLIGRGYDQDRWVTGVDACAQAWLDPTRDERGKPKGPLAEALGLVRRGSPRGLDIVSLGTGEGEKEIVVLKRVADAEQQLSDRLAWLTFAPVDVSIPLLLGAAKSAGELLASSPVSAGRALMPFCADFEEGALKFVDRLPTSSRADQGVRLVLLLGNVLGNLRDEEKFVRERLMRLARPGDLVWIEVGLRMDPLESDPLYRMTQVDGEMTAAEANRRLLLEGPFRRWEAATGRAPSSIETRVWAREDDDSCRVPGSVNFCHDLVLKDERRVCTMLYSRRYRLEALTSWFERLGLSVVRIQRVEDSKQRVRVLHLLLRR